MIVVGCFEVFALAPGRWRVVNILTTFEHVTYGSEEDVRAQLEKQSERWTKRFEEQGPRKPGKRGENTPWRNRTLAPVKKTPMFSTAHTSAKPSARPSDVSSEGSEPK